MDGVVGPRLAIEMGRLGGIAVLTLEGIFSRYANPEDVLDRIVSASQDEATKIIQSIYGEPIKEELIHRRIHEIKKGGDRKSTRLNSSHSQISYAVFCLKKKNWYGAIAM